MWENGHVGRDTAPLDGLDLNLLVTLRALLREANVTRAAERLGQSQPTVSRTLATLRTTFGDPLLVRSGRAMALTPVGQSLRSPVERALAAIDQLGNSGAFVPASSERVFRLILPDIVGSLLLPRVLMTVSRLAPRLRLQVLGSERHMGRDLLHGEVDIVVAAPKLDHPEFFSRTLGEPMGWSIIYQPTHPGFGASMDADQWRKAAHVQLVPAGRPDVVTSNSLDEVLVSQRVARHVPLKVSYLGAIGPVLKRVACVASMPTPVARYVAAEQGLQALPHPLGSAIPPVQLRMTWHETQHADTGHKWLRDQLAAVADTVILNAAAPVHVPGAGSF